MTDASCALIFIGMGGIVASDGALPGRVIRLVIVGVACGAVALVGRMAVYATNVPRPALGSATPASRGLHYVDATFVTSDHVTLSGWYIPSRNRAAVVLLHGASSTRSNLLPQADVLARAGYGVLLFDARGHGRSDGRPMDFGWHGDSDIGGAVSYLQHRPDVDARRIGAVRMSMGGEEAIGAMTHDSRIRATVAEGATNRVFADRAWYADEYGFRGRVQLGVEWLTYRLTDLLTAAEPPVSLRRRAGNGPGLGGSGGGSRRGSARATRRVDAARHALSRRRVPEVATGRVTGSARSGEAPARDPLDGDRDEMIAFARGPIVAESGARMLLLPRLLDLPGMAGHHDAPPRRGAVDLERDARAHNCGVELGAGCGSEHDVVDGTDDAVRGLHEKSRSLGNVHA